MGVVHHAWEPSAQLDRRGERALGIEHGADGGGIGFADDEHATSMGGRRNGCKAVTMTSWRGLGFGGIGGRGGGFGGRGGRGGSR